MSESISWIIARRPKSGSFVWCGKRGMGSIGGATSSWAQAHAQYSQRSFGIYGRITSFIYIAWWTTFFHRLFGNFYLYIYVYIYIFLLYTIENLHQLIHIGYIIQQQQQKLGGSIIMIIMCSQTQQLVFRSIF